MRDFLKPAEYSIIRATLPHALTLYCQERGPCFSHFWNLPPKVRDQIHGYSAPEQESKVNRAAQIDRFELYQTEQAKEGDLLLFAFSHTEKETFIECVGQYMNGVFVRLPHAVSMKMLEKMQAMSKKRWSLVGSSAEHHIPWWQWLAGVIAMVGWCEGAFMPEHLLRTWFLLAVLSVIGLLLPLLQTMEAWLIFRTRRSEIAKQLELYLDAIPQHAKHA